MVGFVLLLSTLAIFAQSHDCNVRNYPSGTVCVCNATYCDTVPSLSVTSGKYQHYSTSKSKLGFYSKIGSFVTKTGEHKNTIKVDRSIKHQTIIGFGGAFTDSAGMNINLLPAPAQQKLLESYFSESGIEYNLCRVPIGGTDFSTRPYSYDDIFDPTLEHFALQPEDNKYKIPHIQQAIKLQHNKLKLIASPWSSPPWMKTNNDWAGMGLLQGQYYQLWADYIIKFLDKYQNNNISFWGLTTQNEPLDGLLPKSIISLNAVGWIPELTNIWVGQNLGPTLRKSAHKNLKLILHDGQRLTIPFIHTMLNNNLTMTYADGVAVHWYTDNLIPPQILTTVKSDLKDVFILSTEACNGYLSFMGKEAPVEKGSWARGAKYIVDIIGNLQYGAAGWVNWNMALDETGGPNYIDNFVDSPVLVNATLQEFYKQPMFYALGHFSKFVTPGSVRVETTLSLPVTLSDVQALAFLRPDNVTAVVIHNNGTSNVTIKIKDSNNQMAVVNIEKFSINTLLFQ